MPIPILSFIKRYWLLLVALVATVLLCQNEALFASVGTLLYIPAAAVTAAAVAYLIRHFAFPKTIDREAHNGQFVREWKALDPRTRVILTVAVTISIFLGVAIIVAGVAR